jgi:hypothetical protein
MLPALALGERIGHKVGIKLHSLLRKAGKKPEHATPPRLGEYMRVPYGPFRFKAHLAKGSPYEVEACTDLRTWSTIASDRAAAEVIEYIDSEAFKFGYRFYRVLAGGVASTSVIGYASMTMPPGFSMIANPFETRETVSELLKGWPDGTRLNKFDTRFFKLGENAVEFGKWTKPSEQLLPGEGAIFYNPTSDYKSLSFAGEVAQGRVSTPIPGGFSIRSSLLPQPGNLEDLGFPISNGDVIHLFDREAQKYALYPFEDGKWTAGAPVVSVGEAFWVAKTEAGNWAQTILGEASEGA